MAKNDIDMIEILIKRMKQEVVTFTFTKVDGTIRIARGTLRNDVLPQTMGTGRPTPDSIQVYYDVDKKSWRSFKKDNLIGIIK
jgi:hypothetical protein